MRRAGARAGTGEAPVPPTAVAVARASPAERCALDCPLRS